MSFKDIVHVSDSPPVSKICFVVVRKIFFFFFFWETQAFLCQSTTPKHVGTPGAGLKICTCHSWIHVSGPNTQQMNALTQVQPHSCRFAETSNMASDLVLFVFVIRTPGGAVDLWSKCTMPTPPPINLFNDAPFLLNKIYNWDHRSHNDSLRHRQLFHQFRDIYGLCCSLFYTILYSVI